jgi:hypothetical protein
MKLPWKLANASPPAVSAHVRADRWKDGGWDNFRKSESKPTSYVPDWRRKKDRARRYCATRTARPAVDKAHDQFQRVLEYQKKTTRVIPMVTLRPVS